MQFEVSGGKTGPCGFNTALAGHCAVSHAACANEIMGVVV